ncbi:MAG: glycerol acyltransferase [Chloroflexi bacterium]|nr:glycerol acyltransferase [Chloroflexota bacterium]
MTSSPRATQTLSQLDALTRINTDDLLKAFGLEQVQWGRQLLAALGWWPARQFAHKIIRYDALVGQAGLQAGGQWALQAFDASLQIRGQAYVPSTGPVLLLANHPGMTDTVALFASITRPDLRVLAASRPFLSALPHTSDKLIYIHEHANNNMAAIRATTNHLRSGGAILTFPAGQIEPDPAVLPGAIESLQDWSESITLFTRLVPETQIVPVLVSGVLSARAQRTPLRKLRRAQKDQEWLASTLQIIIPAYRPTTVQVAFGPPLMAGKLLDGKTAPLITAVTTAMRALIETDYPKR